MKLVGSRQSVHINLRGSASKFGRVDSGLDFELLDDIRVWIDRIAGPDVIAAVRSVDVVRVFSNQAALNDRIAIAV